jgi:hypothetical protein
MTIYQLLFNQLPLFIIHFSPAPASSKQGVNSVAKNCVYRCESVSNFSLCLGALVAETQLVRRSLGEGGSIKNACPAKKGTNYAKQSQFPKSQK